MSVELNVRRSVRLVIGTLMLLAAPMTGLAAAQDRPGPALEFTVGWVGFSDDGIVSEGLVGGAARFYVSPRLSLGPEIGYISGDNHSHFVLTGNVTWDITRPTGNRSGQVVPFLVVGAGLFRTNESFSSGPFSSNEGAFTAGGGVRAFVGDRVTLGVDARVGWELHVRISGSVGVRLGR